MIAQLLNSTATPATAVAGQGQSQGAAEGFAALMQGSGATAGTFAGQPATVATPAEASDPEASELTETFDTETPEGLMALLDQTITELNQGAGQVTPKTALANFAEALGEAPVEKVGDLEAVAELADPELEAALQEKLNSALRLASGAGQLSVASAGVPVVGRVSMQQEVLPSEAPSVSLAGSVAEGQGAEVLAGAGIRIIKQSPPAAGMSALADGSVSAQKTGDAGTSLMSQSAEATLSTDKSANMAGAKGPSASAQDPEFSAAMKAVDPRLTAAESFSVKAEPATILQAGAQNSGTEAALRELAAAAPQTGLTSEPVRLSAPAPTPATPPNPAAPPEEQLRKHVAQQIRSFETGDNKMRFSLSPYGMGEIEIEVVRSESGRMQIAMTTETASVLNLLRQDREQLLDALQSRGISADNADLDFQTFGERGRQDGRAPEGFVQNNTEGSGEPDGAMNSDTGGAQATSLPQGPGQLDILT
ncbi:flagellar hook-length control protein FliK [Sulfitobacter delicatus]|uniref:Flagellar hook-length control protein FliK n=1 Tax=Sulfitobacter delicatus TaxID=218672 RepID=A0A1G7UG01_9RHOB|nr:flagellar hook-length control protein FliK [Sulfitobacter delicatus]SDG46404.1 Flagellar hook-length control protein FliK [Sulfitobacter delicatus]